MEKQVFAEHELVQIVRTHRHVGEHGDRECRLGTRQRAKIWLRIASHLDPELRGKIEQAPDGLRVIELGNRSLVLRG
jgi:hypothetical protein